MMRPNILKSSSAAIGLLLAGSVYAVDDIDIGDVTITAPAGTSGDSAVFIVSLTNVMADTYIGGNFNIDFSDTVFPGVAVSGFSCAGVSFTAGPALNGLAPTCGTGSTGGTADADQLQISVNALGQFSPPAAPFVLNGELFRFTLPVADGTMPSATPISSVTFSQSQLSPGSGMQTDVSGTSTGGDLFVQSGPQADIGIVGNPMGMDLGSLVQNVGGPAMGTFTITNTGDATTTLTGSCDLAAPNAAISVSPSPLVLNLAQNASAVVNVTGDNTQAIAMYMEDWQCTGTNASSGDPAAVTIMFEVASPGPAVFDSTPVAPGGTVDVDMIAGSSPLEMSGDTISANNTLQNTASAGNFDITSLACSLDTGGAPFSINTVAATIPPLGSTTLTVTCDSTGVAAGPYADQVTCNYSEDNGATMTMSQYPVQCDVRAAESDTSFPADGTPVNILVSGFGGTGSANVAFREVNNEGLDASVSCALSGTEAGLFMITSPTFPATIPAGGTLSVQVTGTEPGGVAVTDAFLDCTVTDSANGAQAVSYPLGFIVQPAIVPTLSQWAMIIMALVLAGFGFSRIRREAPTA